jgi:uncharacterized membrane protein
MPDVPVQVMVAAFKDMDNASNVLALLMDAKKDGLIDIEDAAVITKDIDGKTKIRDTHDMGAGKGATIGAISGAVLSLIAGPLGWMALGGGAIGGIAAKMRDGGFPEERLKQLAASLIPGSSALVVVIEHKWVAQLEEEIRKHDADVMMSELDADITKQLASGNDTVYTVATTGDAVFAGRATEMQGEGTEGELVMHDSSYATEPTAPEPEKDGK